MDGVTAQMYVNNVGLFYSIIHLLRRFTVLRGLHYEHDLNNLIPMIYHVNIITK